MRECTERRLEDRADRAVVQVRLNSMQESFDARMTEMASTFERGMGSLNNRMWTIIISTCGAAIIGLAAFVFYEITRVSLR